MICSANRSKRFDTLVPCSFAIRLNSARVSLFIDNPAVVLFGSLLLGIRFSVFSFSTHHKNTVFHTCQTFFFKNFKKNIEVVKGYK